jgi:hypothetical protein
MLAEQFEAAESTAPDRSAIPLVYSDLGIGEGHCQGDVKVQYMGEAHHSQLKHPGALLLVNMREETHFSADSDGGDFESHFIVPKGKVCIYMWSGANPLVGPVVHVSEGGQFSLEHHEHRDVTFTQPGWYVTRFDRQATVRDQLASQSLVRRVD